MLQKILLASILAIANAWQEWDYTSSTHTTDDWRDIWGFASGPGGRRGHTLTLYNKTKLILFGGRDNDMQRPHVPRTFELENLNGTLEFSTYEDKPVIPSYDSSCEPEKICVTLTNSTSGNTEACTYSWNASHAKSLDDKIRHEKECGYTEVGLFYNDVWMYDLGCKRYADLPCQDQGWVILHPGAIYGGCRDENETRVCDAPSERWKHGAVIFDDHIMLVYGGYSHECGDYCDDMWAFDLRTLSWSEVGVEERVKTETEKYNEQSWPGKRWQFSFSSGPTSPILNQSLAILFGGHRIWHGFASDNSYENDWQSHKFYPKGGYLNDLWFYVGFPHNETNGDKYGIWVQQKPKESCQVSPGLSWESRNDVSCEIHWPKGRMGHATIYDNKRHGLWLYGGYTTYFPYISSYGPGSDHGRQTRQGTGFTPYPTYPFYLDDLWFYDIKSGYWEEKVPATLVKPSDRTEHILELSSDILILFGGYSNNVFHNDTWYYYIEENRWLKKEDFVHAEYPLECFEDEEYIELSPLCVELEFPERLIRANETNEARNIFLDDILPYKFQPWHTPDPTTPFYFGIVDDAELFVEELQEKYLHEKVFDKNGIRIWIESTVPDGTPIAPKAATAPRQYAQPKQIAYNDTTTIEVWEWCVRGKGEPTRDSALDGINGRGSKPIFIPQPKRKSPGWDGCREFKWKQPSARSDISGVYVDEYKELILYGGVGTSDTNEHNQKVMNDMWMYDFETCIHNCSNHGICRDGFCECDLGYYGIDCSNITCPGSVCYYDRNHIQHCKHCCHDGYIHSTDDDEGDFISYVDESIQKRTCSQVTSKLDESYISFTGQSNGICDGWGKCQCAPPFIGDDCSMRDCKVSDCNNNGYCSVEYPISRCVCNPGYFGESCEYIECLNNCTSSSNGICNFQTGQCTCKYLYNETDNADNVSINTMDIESKGLRWEGEDCSYLIVWSAAEFDYKGHSSVIRISIWTLVLYGWIIL